MECRRLAHLSALGSGRMLAPTAALRCGLGAQPPDREALRGMDLAWKAYCIWGHHCKGQPLPPWHAEELGRAAWRAIHCGSVGRATRVPR